MKLYITLPCGCKIDQSHVHGMCETHLTEIIELERQEDERYKAQRADQPGDKHGQD